MKLWCDHCATGDMDHPWHIQLQVRRMKEQTESNAKRIEAQRQKIAHKDFSLPIVDARAKVTRQHDL